MMGLTIEGWPERMREKGHRVLVHSNSGYHTCTLVNREKGLFCFGHGGDLITAIKQCQERFGLRMLLNEMAAMDDKEVQDANVKEVKRLLGE